jgi:multicomponent Na+:H+ antiporter subunit B
MSRRVRLVLFGSGAVVMSIFFVMAAHSLPAFGAAQHLYRDLAVRAALSHATANVVSSVNFDLRAADTLGEETVLLASVIGVMALLRPALEERELRPRARGHAMDATRLMGYVMLPVTLAVGVDLVVHGHITPGGGFQGGVMIAIALHLLYVAGSFRALDRLRPVNVFDIGELAGAATFVLLGICGLIFAGAFLANFIRQGQPGVLFSAGTVPLFNIAVGVEVACGITVLLAQFLAQEITIVKRGERR